MIETQFTIIQESRQELENHTMRADELTHHLKRSLGFHHRDPDVQGAINITQSTISSLRLAIEAGEKLILELEKGRDLT